MTTIHTAVSNSGTGPRYTLPNAYHLIVGQPATLVSIDDNAIRSDGLVDRVAVTVIGTVGADLSGIYLQVKGFAQVNVVQSGVISAETGVAISGSSLINNDGAIIATGFAINCVLASGQHSQIFNTGNLQSGYFGIVLSTDNGSTASVTNSGRITADYAIAGGYGNETIINSGTIIGTVDLGVGNDVFTTRGAGAVFGSILGGAGNDIFNLGAGVEVVFAEDGLDVLDFRYGGGLVVNLTDNMANTGWAAGDRYVGIENVIGSMLGADMLVGNAAANTLQGLGGKDVLSGGAGNDQLIGGIGADTLTGGAGSDRFEFWGIGQAGDVITDFTNAAGNDDALRIQASGFGGGLAAGTLAAARFFAGTTNAANDADCRFILRTTDKTVWFDADGNGAAAPVMVADLQQGATFTASDVLIF